jgi:hypothetical protein
MPNPGAFWTFPPQAIFTELLDAAHVRVARSGTRDRAGAVTSDFVRQFRLSYTLVDSATQAQMAAFYQQQQGAALPFTWVNPNDGYPYLVRFAEEPVGLELFAPGFWRGTVDVVFTVVAALAE